MSLPTRCLLFKFWLALQVGVCAYAPPDCTRRVIETASCLQCAKCLLYHCMSDPEGNYVHPCECSNSDGHWTRRWIGLTLLSILVPCLCCYVPLMGCYKCGTKCNVCGGRHEAQGGKFSSILLGRKCSNNNGQLWTKRQLFWCRSLYKRSKC